MKKQRLASITQAYMRYERDMHALDRQRLCDCDLTAWAFHVADARHHTCFALSELELLEHAGQTYEQMTDVQRFVVREAYLALVNVAQAIGFQAAPLADGDALANGRRAVGRMLDALTSYVSGAEAELRRIVLEPAGSLLEPLSGTA